MKDNQEFSVLLTPELLEQLDDALKDIKIAIGTGYFCDKISVIPSISHFINNYRNGKYKEWKVIIDFKNQELSIYPRENQYSRHVLGIATEKLINNPPIYSELNIPHKDLIQYIQKFDIWQKNVKSC